MKPVNVAIVAKKIDGKYEGVYLVDNRFTRILTGTALVPMVQGQISKILKEDFPEGVDVAINISINEDDTIQPKEEEKE